MNPLDFFWSIVLIASMVIFFGIAAIVAVKGVDDIKTLFQHLTREKKEINE